MKLSDFVPEIGGILEYQNKLSTLSNYMDLSKSSGGAETYRAPSVGLDYVVNQWVRQQMAYRMNLMQDLWNIAMTVEEIRAPVKHIIDEVFRRGLEWTPKFAVQCRKCQVEYQEVTEECENCGSNDLREPDEEQKELFDRFKNDANLYDQSLEEVLRQFWFDVNSLDIGWIYIAKEYIEDGEEGVRSKPLEIRRIHPALIELDLDRGGIPKNSHWLCYIHRDRSPESEPGECDECGRMLQPAMYKMYKYGSSGGLSSVGEGQNVMYLFDSEIISASKFYTDEMYGWSPIMTIIEKALTLVGMDRNIYRYFWERRMPASMIMVFTDDPESLRREREQMAARMRQDPNYIPMVAVSNRQARGRMDMVRLFHTLQEMDYMPVRNEIRERIAAMWGVTPAWQGAPEAYGGLSTTSQQLTVMSRVIESDQRILHERVFPNLMEAFGITDWVIELPSPEEKAEATRISFAQQKVAIASQLHQMGFEIKIKSPEVGIDEIDFMVSGEAQSQQDMFGGMGGGMPGLGGFGGDEMGGEEMPQEENGDEDQKEQGPIYQLMEKSKPSPKTWISQIMNMGFLAPMVKGVYPNGEMLDVAFEYGNAMWKANFVGNNLVAINKIEPEKLHQHGKHPPHPVSLPHDSEMGTRQERRDYDSFAGEEPESSEMM